MSNQTKSILSNTKKKDKYNILTFDTHERYQTQLCKTGHNFYSFRSDGAKEWDTNYAPLPENYYVLPPNSIINGLDFDFILSQSKFGQFQMAKRMQAMLGVPILSLEHTLPIPNWPTEQLEQFKSMQGDVNVFISEYSVGRWGMSVKPDVIHHSVDSELFQPSQVEKQNKVLSVVNDFANRDYCCNYSGWQRITNSLKEDVEVDVKVVGTCSHGLAKPAESLDALVKEYCSASVFLNTSTVSPVPTSLLEAMSCGCAVVSTATCMIPEIIENGVNGFISNDEDELKSYIKDLLDHSELRRNVGEAARQTILDRFSEDKFINNWNNIFDKTHGVAK
jgi:glycosyltransferase involved in cell wall biosynthesis